MDSAILESFFEKERLLHIHKFDPLDQHEVTHDYRIKMVDWMIEVCTSF